MSMDINQPFLVEKLVSDEVWRGADAERECFKLINFKIIKIKLWIRIVLSAILCIACV